MFQRDVKDMKIFIMVVAHGDQGLDSPLFIQPSHDFGGNMELFGFTRFQFMTNN